MADLKEPTDEQIRERAYELYLQRGGAPGLDVDDWLAAEQELTALSGAKISWVGTELTAELEAPDLQSEDSRTTKKKTASA